LLAAAALFCVSGEGSDRPRTRLQRVTLSDLQLAGLVAGPESAWNVSLPGDARREMAVSGDVFGGRLLLSLRLGRNPGSAAVRLSVYLVNRNGWFYKSAQDYLLTHRGFRDIEIDLSPDSAQLVPAGSARPWGDAAGLAVERIGLALFANGTYSGPVEVRRAEIAGGSQAPSLGPAALSVEGLEIRPAAPGVGDMVELAFRLPVSFANPFDPETADVGVAVTAPDGSSRLFPAFYDQDYLPVQEGFEVRAVPVGPGRWMARFTAGAEGPLAVRFLFAGSPVGSATVTVSGAGRRGGDEGGGEGGGLQRTDDAHAERLGSAFGEQFLRTMPADPGRGLALWQAGAFRQATPDPGPCSAWMAPLEWTDEWGCWLGVGRYNLEVAWKLDLVLDRAARSGVRRPICLNLDGMLSESGRSPADEPQLHGGRFLESGRYRWAFNPLSAGQGGPLAVPEQYFTDPQAERAAAALFRYILARWGQHPAVDGAVLAVTLPAEGAAAWHERVGRRLAAWFPSGGRGGELRLASWHPQALAMPDAIAIGSFEDGAPKGWQIDRKAFPDVKVTYSGEVRSEGQRSLKIEGGFAAGEVCCLFRPLEMNCAASEQLSFDACLPADAPAELHVRVMVLLRDRELNWYQRLLPGDLSRGRWRRFLIDLREGRNGLAARPARDAEPAAVRPWDDYSRQRLRVLGLRFFAWSGIPDADGGDGLVQEMARTGAHSGSGAADGADASGMPAAAFASGDSSATPRSAAWQGALFVDNIRLHGPGRLAAERSGELRMLDFRAENAEAPETFARIEYSFALDRAFANPYDPDCVDVRVVVMTPSGRTMTVPGFYYQGYGRRLVRTVRVEDETGAEREVACPDGAEELLPAGGSLWKIRLAAAEPGEHRLEIQVRAPGPDGSPVTLLSRQGLAFTARSGRRRGYVRVAEDGRHLEHSTGEFFYPIGMALRSPSDARDLSRDEGIRRRIRGDVPVRLMVFRTGYEEYFDLLQARGTYQFDDYLEQCGKAGANWARVWMCPWWLGLEWDHRYPGYEGAGRYSQANAWRLDHVIEQAERCGVYLQLCLVNHGQVAARIDRQWDFNPYNRVMPREHFNPPDRPAEGPREERPGGFLEYPRDFFVNERARALFRQRLRYLAARWGYSTSLMGYEIMSEVEFTGGTEFQDERAFDNRPQPLQAQWHREMAQYLRTIDPFRHLVTTHFSHPCNGSDVWNTQGLDYVQSNAYSSFSWLGGSSRPDGTAGAPSAMDGYYRRFMEQWKRPVLIGEWGGHWMSNSREVLDAELHCGLWAQAATPMAGATGYWWWLHVHYNGRYGEFSALSRYVHGEDLRGVTRQLPARAARAGAGGAEFDALAAGDASGRSYAYVCAAALRRSLARKDSARFKAGEVRLELGGMPGGSYAVEFWDTWTGRRASTATAASTGGTLVIELPAFEGDLALKIRRSGGAAGAARSPAPGEAVRTGEGGGR
jgi:hypothetical protein